VCADWRWRCVLIDRLKLLGWKESRLNFAQRVHENALNNTREPMDCIQPQQHSLLRTFKQQKLRASEQKDLTLKRCIGFSISCVDILQRQNERTHGTNVRTTFGGLAAAVWKRFETWRAWNCLAEVQLVWHLSHDCWQCTSGHSQAKWFRCAQGFCLLFFQASHGWVQSWSCHWSLCRHEHSAKWTSLGWAAGTHNDAKSFKEEGRHAKLRMHRKKVTADEWHCGFAGEISRADSMDSEQAAQFKVQACSCYTLARGSHKVGHAIWQTKFQIQNNERSDVTLIVQCPCICLFQKWSSVSAVCCWKCS